MCAQSPAVSRALVRLLPADMNASLRLIVAHVLLPGIAAAQSTSTEIWPELDIYWRPAERQRTMLELSTSTEREGSKREGSIGIYQDYLSLPRYYVRAGYRFTFSIRDASYRESRLLGEGTIGSQVAELIRLVNRTRLELRWINGEYSYRIRDRLHLQRQQRSATALTLWPYGTFEAYYDSRHRSISRLGGRVGAETPLARKVSIDVYVARQNNLRSEAPRRVNALGMTTRLSY